MALARGDIIEIDSDSDSSDEPEEEPLSLQEVIKLCQVLEENSVVGDAEDALNFVEAAAEFRLHLQRKSRRGSKTDNARYLL